MTHFDETASPVIHSPNSTLGGVVESIGVMKRAVLYARVSTDAQEKEGTIKSQVFELKRQIAAAGDVLVKEYIDDGYSGTRLDRPALEQLRADLKTGLFDTVYFHSADRIARDVAHQIIIVGELLKYGKRITINGKDYQQNPENKLTLTMLGAFSEFERAKIIERYTRGRLHKLRMGLMGSSSGHRIYGYHYARKTREAPATLAINEEQAAIVRLVFEMFATGNYGLVTISRFLEERHIPTFTGRPLWDNDRVKCMLKNETYTGVRYYNRITKPTGSSREGKKLIRGQWVFRDRAEWIPIKVPAIVSRELFEQVQAASGDVRLPFRIEGKIDIKAVRSESCRIAALAQLRAELEAAAAAASATNQPVLSPLSASPTVAA